MYITSKKKKNPEKPSISVSWKVLYYCYEKSGTKATENRFKIVSMKNADEANHRVVVDKDRPSLEKMIPRPIFHCHFIACG